MSRSVRRTRLREAGTAALEVVTLVPILLIAALLVTQVGFVGWTAVSADRAARAAARAASLDRDVNAAARGAVPGNINIQSIQSLGSSNGVRYRVTLDIPVIGVTNFGSISREAEFPKIS